MNNLDEMTDDELDVLESRLADSIDAISEAQALIQRVRESRQQPELPLGTRMDELMKIPEVKNLKDRYDRGEFRNCGLCVMHYDNNIEKMAEALVEYMNENPDEPPQPEVSDLRASPVMEQEDEVKFLRQKIKILEEQNQILTKFVRPN